MNLNEAKELTISLMRQHGLVEKGWGFEFDNAKRRFGVCRHGRKIIGLSKEMVLLNDLPIVKNTILHEIAHALVDSKHGHDSVWRAKALEIGCDGERCYSTETTNIVKGKYIACCPNCKKEHRRFRKPKYNASCGKCSSTYNEKYKLNWEKTEK